MTLYIWREFCENPVPPPVFGPAIHDVMGRLKILMAASSAAT
jgi:hypothetical protein